MSFRFVDIIPYLLGALSLAVVASLVFIATRVEKSQDVDRADRRKARAEEEARKASETAEKLKAKAAELTQAAQEARRTAQEASKKTEKAEERASASATEISALKTKVEGLGMERERARRAADAQAKRRAQAEEEVRQRRARQEREKAARADFRFGAWAKFRGFLGLATPSVPSPFSKRGLCGRKEFFFRFQAAFLAMHASGSLRMADGGVAAAKAAIWSGNFAKIVRALALSIRTDGQDAQGAARSVTRTLAVLALREAASTTGSRCPYELLGPGDVEALREKSARYAALFGKFAAKLPQDAQDVETFARFREEKELDADMARRAGRGAAWVVDFDRDARTLDVGVALPALFSLGFRRLVTELAARKNVDRLRFLV